MLAWEMYAVADLERLQAQFTARIEVLEWLKWTMLTGQVAGSDGEVYLPLETGRRMAPGAAGTADGPRGSIPHPVRGSCRGLAGFAKA